MIEVKNLNKTYDRGRAGDHRVLKDISFELPEKGFVCILGPSGCGKTSLLNAIGGLDRFDNGSLSAGDTHVSRYGTAVYEAERNRNFGYIFQNYYLLDNHSVAYNVYLGLHSLDLPHKEKLKRVRMALKAVDMERYIRRKVSDLSGGQQQRIAIARALARRPRVIFADEPTGNLDEANTRNICTLLRQAASESLVIMVTHEEHIANFFADRIIRLDQGRIASDSESWERDQLHLNSDKELYTGDYVQSNVDRQQISLRLLQTPGAEPVQLTVVAEKDRIILKLSDSRTITLSGTEEAPKIIDGQRPVITLETISQDSSQSALFREPAAKQYRAGKGISLSMMARESMSLMQGKGLKRAGMRIFLVLLTVLTLLTVADFITISKVDPQDFITADSHILQVTVAKGENTITDGTSPPLGYWAWYNYHLAEYIGALTQADTDFDFLPVFSKQPEYTLALFYQMTNAKQRFPAFSYTPIERLDSEDLLWGRMPESSEEVVIDRILLDAMLEGDGIVQNGIRDYSSFLGEKLLYGNKNFDPVIVGVSDSGERSIYASKSTLYALGSQGTILITVSELQERYPGIYDTITMTHEGKEDNIFQLKDLGIEDCIVNASAAGVIWKYRVGQIYGTLPNQKTVRAYIENEDMSAWIIVADEALEQMIINNYSDTVTLWCADKEAMKEYLSQPTQWEEDGYLQISVSDPYAEAYAQYQQAASIRADARTIVTATILALCMVMLYLLCRTQANERLGLIAVYRLLGIPGSKLHGIFLLEGVVSALGTVVPTAALTWLAVMLAEKVPELESTLELPWEAAAIAGGCIVLYYLAVSLLPLARLLRFPPAQLAAKYDM